MDLFAVLVNTNIGEHEHYRGKLYAEMTKHELVMVSDLTWADLRGKNVLSDWMKPRPFAQVQGTLSDEMGSLSAELNTTTGEITPNYLSSWSLDTSVGSVVHVQAPTLLAIVHTAAQSTKSLKNTKKDTSPLQ